MNSNHTNGENGRSFDDTLDKLGQAYGKLEHEEPPELLDQAILNSAHRAVEKKPHWTQFGWLHGLTTAAVFVLAFSIILNQREPSTIPENGVISNQPARSQVEKEARTDTAVQVGESTMELKVKSDDRQRALRSIPVTAEPESPVIEVASEEQLAQPAAETVRPMSARDSLAGKSEYADPDTLTVDMMQEEVMLDEASSMAVSPQAGAVSKVALPAAVSDPGEGDAKKDARMESEAEQKLQAIIRLKQSGDETWRTELESFVQTYPDYPLPDDLKD